MKKQQNKNSRGYILLASLSFAIPLALLYSYSYWLKPIAIMGFELKKIIPDQEVIPIEEVRPILSDFPSLKVAQDTLKPLDTMARPGDGLDTTMVYQPLADTDVSQVTRLQDSLSKLESGTDGISQRVLIMGDSETGGLCFQLNDYCLENGHKLVASIIWNSASILNLAYADTISKTILKYKPTYIFIVVGLNEMYAKDLANRKKAAQTLAKKIEGIPYTWIGPANYREDFGINRVFMESAEQGTYYLTKKLDLPKGQDKRHPSKDGYRIWMDSLATWVQNQGKYKIKLAPPAKRGRAYKSRIINLNAAKYRGY